MHQILSYSHTFVFRVNYILLWSAWLVQSYSMNDEFSKCRSGRFFNDYNPPKIFGQYKPYSNGMVNIIPSPSNQEASSTRHIQVQGNIPDSITDERLQTYFSG